MADIASGGESLADFAPQHAFNIQAHLRGEREQIAFLNAALSEGRPEVLVGAIWDVMKANDVTVDQGAGTGTNIRASDSALTPDQIVAARGLLGWSASMLAKRCDLSVRTVELTEQDRPRSARSLKVLARIRAGLEAVGIVFEDENGDGPGVRLRSST